MAQKLKVKGGAKKRLILTGSGKIKRKKAFHRHILTKKNAKRKRNLRQNTLVSENDHKTALRMLQGG